MNYCQAFKNRNFLYQDIINFISDIKDPARNICNSISLCDYCIEFDGLCSECPIKDICDSSNELFDNVRKLESLIKSRFNYEDKLYD